MSETSGPLHLSGGRAGLRATPAATALAVTLEGAAAAATLLGADLAAGRLLATPIAGASLVHAGLVGLFQGSTALGLHRRDADPRHWTAWQALPAWGVSFATSLSALFLSGWAGEMSRPGLGAGFLLGLVTLPLVRQSSFGLLARGRAADHAAGMLLKRCVDVAGAGFGLLLLSPFLLLTAAMVVLDSPGPALFRQERRGFEGAVFRIWKFRTMTVMEPGHAMVQAAPGDARVTGLGRLLRNNSIDELPQLLNVLGGEMSLVGPRPHALSHDDAMAAELPDYIRRRRMKPGITGLAQVNGFRGQTDTFEQRFGRLRLDLEYIDTWSLGLDLKIVWLTLFSRRARQNAG